MGFPKIISTLFGVPILKIIVFRGLYWGPLILGNCHVGLGLRGVMDNLIASLGLIGNLATTSPKSPNQGLVAANPSCAEDSLGFRV